MNHPARFQIVQDRHIPGVPGEIVAEGVRFSSGHVAIYWQNEPLVSAYTDLPALYGTHFDKVSMALHWIDPPPPGVPTVNDSGVQNGGS